MTQSPPEAWKADLYLGAFWYMVAESHDVGCSGAEGAIGSIGGGAVEFMMGYAELVGEDASRARQVRCKESRHEVGMAWWQAQSSHTMVAVHRRAP
jgi:hypothetical protein